MEEDGELQATLAQLAEKGQEALTREERRQRQRSLQGLGVLSFDRLLEDAGCTPLRRGAPHILQLNIGLYCNQACSHCHVESSPRRTEAMDRATAGRCLQLLSSSPSVSVLDLTGGAPELTPQFRYLVTEARRLGVPEIIDRCNLTALLEPGQEDLASFLAEHRVRVVASLPCYGPQNVDKQRGAGVFERSIQALRLLNSVGYAQPGSSLQLDLVYNPGGAFLAPPQAQLEEAYRSELQQAYGVLFTNLLCLNNMPVKRFAEWLLRRGQLQEYMGLLVRSFNPAAAEGVMCRDTVNVGWDGRLFDCDFNAQLAMPLLPEHGGGSPLTVWDIDGLEDLTGRRVRTDNHCFGCTAGSGSSCQGAVVSA